MTDLLIVDDHVVLREGLRTLLDMEADFDVIGEAGTGAEATEFVRRQSPDVILLDLNLPDGNGADFCRTLLGISPKSKVLVLSAYDEQDGVTAALLAGASGYLLKTTSRNRLADSIRMVQQGEVLLSPAIAAKVVEQLGRLQESEDQRDDALTVLTPREREVFGLASRGLRNAEIAEALFLSEKTVKTHLRNIYGKLGLSSKADLRVFAHKIGMVPGPED